MKKNVLLILILLFPCFLKAETYSEANNIAENYMSRSNYLNHYKRYIVENSGSLIDKNSYLITLNRRQNEYSYLYDGYEYWSGTEENNKVFVVPNKTYEKNNNVPETRVVETIINDRKVTGKGTRENPWFFVPVYNAIITSNKDETISTDSHSFSSRVEFNFYLNEEKIVYLNEGTYKYRNNSCNTYIHKVGDTLVINNAIRDLRCEITFTNSSLVTLDRQGGSGGTGSVKAFINEKLPNITIPTKEGYTFDGYYGSINGDGIKYYDSMGNGIIWLGTNNTTIYAKWIPNTYYVKYNENDGSGSMSTSTHTYGTAMELTENAFTRTGYKFTGWNTKKDGTGTSYTDRASVNNLTTTNGGTVTLYAKWTVNTYTLTYNANGGSVSPTSKSVTYKAQYGTLPIPTKEGYIFKGWYTASSGGSKVSSTTNMEANNTKIYAQWELACAINPGEGSKDNAEALVDALKKLGLMSADIQQLPNGWWWAITDYTVAKSQAKEYIDKLAVITHYQDKTRPYLYWVAVKCSNGSYAVYERDEQHQNFIKTIEE